MEQNKKLLALNLACVDAWNNLTQRERELTEYDEFHADFLAARGVAVVDGVNVIALPCPVGSTLYRIDGHTRACSYHHNTRDSMYYCVNDYNCRHLCDGKCDAGTDYRLFVIKDASAMAILGNADLIGTRVFLNEEEARTALEKKREEERKIMEQEAVKLSPTYECYRDYWDEDDEE